MTGARARTSRRTMLGMGGGGHAAGLRHVPPGSVPVGVPTELPVAPGAFHGFEKIIPQAGVSRRFSASLESALSRAVGKPS